METEITKQEVAFLGGNFSVLVVSLSVDIGSIPSQVKRDFDIIVKGATVLIDPKNNELMDILSDSELKGKEAIREHIKSGGMLISKAGGQWLSFTMMGKKRLINRSGKLRYIWLKRSGVPKISRLEKPVYHQFVEFYEGLAPIIWVLAVLYSKVSLGWGGALASGVSLGVIHHFIKLGLEKLLWEY
jgi:hypothetical protein